MKKIVLIDDNEITRVTLRALLRGAGYDVVGTAATGETGIEQIARHLPDLVCLDVVMPGRSGLDILCELRARWPKLIVLMVTGKTDRQSIDEMLRFGAAGIVVKPFTAASVLEPLRAALGEATPARKIAVPDQ